MRLLAGSNFRERIFPCILNCRSPAALLPGVLVELHRSINFKENLYEFCAGIFKVIILEKLLQFNELWSLMLNSSNTNAALLAHPVLTDVSSVYV